MLSPTLLLTDRTWTGRGEWLVGHPGACKWHWQRAIWASSKRGGGARPALSHLPSGPPGPPRGWAHLHLQLRRPFSTDDLGLQVPLLGAPGLSALRYCAASGSGPAACWLHEGRMAARRKGIMSPRCLKCYDDTRPCPQSALHCFRGQLLQLAPGQANNRSAMAHGLDAAKRAGSPLSKPILLLRKVS